MSPQEIISFNGVSRVSIQELYDFYSFLDKQDNGYRIENFKNMFDTSEYSMLTSVTGDTSQEIIDKLNKFGFTFDYKSCAIHFVNNPKQEAFFDFFGSLYNVAHIEDADILLSSSDSDEVAIDTFKVIFIVL